MLSVSTLQMEAFAAMATGMVLSHIDEWLIGSVAPWAKLDPARRNSELGQIAEHAKACHLLTKNDLAVFAWICATIGLDWRQKITAPDLWRVLTDSGFGVQAKLLRLEETFMAAGAER